MATLHDAIRAMGIFDSDTVQERPWGSRVDGISTNEATLECMVVRPRAPMSLQKHAARREVWCAKSGHGKHQGDESISLVPGPTHFVGVGQVNRIANTGDKPLVIVEMQMGTRSGKDIVRLEDDHERA